MQDIQLTEHFKLSEFRCNDHAPISGCGGAVIIPPANFMDNLEKARQRAGKTKVNRGYSCYYWNIKVGGAKESFHTQVKKKFEKYGAADIQCLELKAAFGIFWIDEAIKIIKEFTTLNGMIAHKAMGDLMTSYIHVDGREEPYFQVLEV